MAPMGFWESPMASALLILMASGLLLMSMFNPSIFNTARTNAINTFSPALTALSYPFQEASSFVRNVSGLTHLQTRNALLEKENARLRDWYQTALTLQQQNQSLKELLNVKTEEKYPFITARVIGDAGNSFVKSMIVKAGSLDGVQEGNAVISGKGVLGRIIQSGGNASRILLLSDMNSRVPVMISETGDHAILAGKNSESPTLEHLVKDTKLEVGARVTTSGHGGMFPAGLPVGNVIQDERGVYRVELMADTHNTQYVRIIQSHEDPNLKKGNLE